MFRAVMLVSLRSTGQPSLMKIQIPSPILLPPNRQSETVRDIGHPVAVHDGDDDGAWGFAGKPPLGAEGGQQAVDLGGWVLTDNGDIHIALSGSIGSGSVTSIAA